MDKKKAVCYAALCLLMPLAGFLWIQTVSGAGLEATHIIQTGENVGGTGTDYYVSDSSKVVMNFTLKTFKASSATIELYGDQIKDWTATLSAASLSVTAGQDVPISVAVDVSGGIPSGTYGMILQGKDGSAVIWRTSLFVHVNAEKMLLSHPRVNHDGWISGENFPRELHLPYKSDVDVVVWVKRMNETFDSLWVDVDYYRNGVFEYHKAGNYRVAASWTEGGSPVGTTIPVGSEGRTWHMGIGDPRRYTSSDISYVIYVKYKESSMDTHEGTIETSTVNCRSFCPGAHPPLTTLSLDIHGSSTSGTYLPPLEVSSEEFKELKSRVEELNLTLTALNETLFNLNETLFLSTSNTAITIEGLRVELNETLGKLQSTDAFLTLTIAKVAEALTKVEQTIGEVNIFNEDVVEQLTLLQETQTRQAQLLQGQRNTLNYLTFGLIVMAIVSALLIIIIMRGRAK